MKIRDLRTRNLIRGALADERATRPPIAVMNALRQAASPRDLAQCVTLLLGKSGAFPFANLGRDYGSLLRIHSLEPASIEREIAFVVGHLNGWKEETCKIVDAIRTFAAIPTSPASDAMQALAKFTEQFGASSYGVRKVAYLMARFPDDAALQEPFQLIANKVAQSRNPGPYFIAMELVDDNFAYFPGVSTRVQIHQKLKEDDYRKLLALHDLVPAPLSRPDLGALLRKSHSMSLIDEICGITSALNFGDRWDDIRSLVLDLLDPSIVGALSAFANTPFDARALYNDVSAAEADMVYYQRAFAFTEFVDCARYRAFVDAVLAPRLLSKLSPKIDRSFAAHESLTVRDLTKALQGFREPNDFLKHQCCGSFLKTVQLITYLQTVGNAARFDQHEMRFICEHTTGLEYLLTEVELERLYVSAEEASRPLVTVLALALHKARSRDEDVDFKFRFALCETVNTQFRGSLQEFIEWLLKGTPQIANYLVKILDRQTLQKLYWLVSSADEADTTRQALLRAVGRQRNSIAYFVEADAIEAQRQVAKLRKYFDDSRLYVDGIAMQEWLVANPSTYAQQYIKMIEHNLSVPARSAKIEHGQLVDTGTIDIPAVQAFDYVLMEVAKIAYEQFCTNRQFGIESYLGRRIRHNTLTGMMRGGVEDLIERPSYHILKYDDRFVAANDAWIESYQRLIEHLRRDILQFRTDSKPHGIFIASLKRDENTFLGIAALSSTMTAVLPSIELMNELLIRFCWHEINPQLQAAARLISVDLLKRTYDDIEAHLGHFADDMQGQYRAQLREAVHERFTRLASWFRQPEDGFVSATTRQVGDLIFLEANGGNLINDRAIDWQGDAFEVVIDGLSVHRMYDCLFVLLRNALKYGDAEAPITIAANQTAKSSERLSQLRVSVTSTFDDVAERPLHETRLEENFSSDDPGEAMVVEGYSGIKKLRYITRSSEGTATAAYKIDGDQCTVSFLLTVELAKASGSTE
ncbi:hypothetical protein [Bradyrhizobium sp. URHA0013]|uniref:hypothetical protein n=1 Tax=Bradyrhizobium sp. URHA0013 TaxID=1380352 RepID=UPI0012DC1239|nr:hypothetical protein [Bradyrhizobium sp. URHA0013]